MVGIEHALRSFQNGAYSEEELYAAVDKILDGSGAKINSLLEILDEENTKSPLPNDVHKAVLLRIEQAAGAKKTNNPKDFGTVYPFINLQENGAKLVVTKLNQQKTDFSDIEAENDSCQLPEFINPERSRYEDSNVGQMKTTGDVLNGRFVLEDCIGKGGMSAIYKALDLRKIEADDRNPYVAVKVLNLEFRSRPDSLMALQREAKKSQNLAHPNIVRVYDFDRDGDTVYMTMEYLPGESLAQLLKTPGFHGLPQDEVMRIVKGMAKALIFAHDNGIVHADFKPANVILTDSGQVKVIDLGIARAFQRADDKDLEATLFDPGSLGALTPTYASPEMLDHEDPDPRDDIYALACITYELLTGMHPFGRMRATEARKAELEPIKKQQLSRRQWKALKPALCFDREKRTADVRSFLRDVNYQHTVSVPIPETKSLVIIGMAMLLLLIGSVVYFGSNPPDNSLQLSKSPMHQTEFASMESPSPILSEDAVRSLLLNIPCSALDASIKNGAITVTGYVSGQYNLKKLENRLLNLPGIKTVNTKLAAKIATTKCSIIDLYAPYWIKNNAINPGVSVQTPNNSNSFMEGEALSFNIKTPAFKSFVNVDYYSLDGGVVHMLPSESINLSQIPARNAIAIGQLGEWAVSAPFGTELVVVLSTPEPLFTNPRKEVESSADYLTAVTRALDKMSKQSDNQNITAEFMLVNTQALSKH